MTNPPVEHLVIQIAWLLVGATIISIIAWRFKLPYAVALVLGGLAIEESHVVSVPTLDPGVVLFLFLPPLLFDASFRLDERQLRLVARPVALLAVPGVFVTALLVGGAVWLALDVPLGVGLLFGSIVAATDPVAVLGVVRRLKVPARLAIVPEAESLVNDGMAITLYTALIGYALTGAVDLLDVGRLLIQEIAGGVVIGAVLGVIVSRIARQIDDRLIEMMLSTVLAYGSFLVAHQLHTSGPLACVAAGLIHGSYGRTVGMSVDTSERLDDLWEYLGFIANALVFLLVGFSVNVGSLRNDAWPVAVAIVAVLIARVVVVMGTRLTSTPEAPVLRGERIVVIWAGLRGALTIALALALPAETPSRGLLIAMAFGVVLFTMAVQGLSLPLVIRVLGLTREEAHVRV
jgi:CPA1 family monovalent cation:H+ antiporter